MPVTEQSQVQEIDPEKTYSVSEIARVTELHPNTIRKDLQEDNLKGKQGLISRRWKVRGSDLIEYLEKR